MKKHRGLMLIVLSVVLCVIETIYFGCNTKPLTPAETICDGICTIILWAGFFLGAFDWTDYFWSKVTIENGSKNE